jgi:mono/diheme cytochrome c family protein
MRIGSMAVALLLGMVSALLVSWPGAAADAQSPSGPELFVTHCASCHQAGGEGIVGTFPPLLGNPSAGDAAYVETVVREGKSGPIEVLGTNYDGVMAPVVDLSDPEIAALVDYVVELAGPAGPGDAGEPAAIEPGAATVAQPAVGDAEHGRRLFIGSRRFAAGAPACGSCHTAGSVGDHGGAALGPDLTASYQTLGGQAGLTGWLGNPPSATMAPIFAERPLTESELTDLVSFLADAPNQEQPNRGSDGLIVAAVVGLAVLVAGMTVMWPGPRRPYAAQLRRTQ